MGRKTRKKNGGKVIDSGGFGCVFKPALKCKTAKHRTPGISKLGTSSDVNAEWDQFTKIKKLLKKIPNYTDYFLISDITTCNPAKLTKQDKIDFNPNKLNEPELNWPVIVNVINSGGSKNDKETITDSTFFSVEGFRIQLLATQDRFNAEKFKSELEKIYKNKIYIIFEAPNYKVRVGDFINRKRMMDIRNNIFTA